MGLNRRGLSLVELLMASAASVVVLLATGQYMLSQLRQNRSIEQSVEANAIQQDVTRLYSHDVNCQVFFGGKNGNAASVLPDLRDGAGGVHYAVGTTYGGGLLQLNQIQMVPVPPPSLAGKRGQFLIRMTMARTGSTSGMGTTFVDVPIFFEADATTNLIKDCTGTRLNVVTGLECITVSQTIFGQFLNVACPAGYQLAGGGMLDADICKCAIRDGPIVPGSPGFPTGGWVCQEESTSSLTCYARCCRPAP